MSYSISTLLTRHLYDVFGENDPARVGAFIHLKGIGRGLAEGLGTALT